MTRLLNMLIWSLLSPGRWRLNHVIRERRSDLTQYCVLFTCFASRAVHIEVVNAMDTDSFNQALRFIARRGTVWSISSDNGANFVGGFSEFKKTLDEMNQEKIRKNLLKSGKDWVKWQENPPGAPHKGGIWEHKIRSARTILEGLLKTHGSNLNNENLRILIAETEAIINCLQSLWQLTHWVMSIVKCLYHQVIF